MIIRLTIFRAKLVPAKTIVKLDDFCLTHKRFAFSQLTRHVTRHVTRRHSPGVTHRGHAESWFRPRHRSALRRDALNKPMAVGGSTVDPMVDPMKFSLVDLWPGQQW